MKLLTEQAKRMAHEKRLLEDLPNSLTTFESEEWGKDDGNLCHHFKLKLPVGEIQATLIYPPFFPDVPAYIRPREKGESWSDHQYGGDGVFCLERGSDNWSQEVTGADLIQSLNKLLWLQAVRAIDQNFPPVQSRHTVTYGQSIRFEWFRFLVSQELRKFINLAELNKPYSVRATTSYISQKAVSIVTKIESDPEIIFGDVPTPELLDGYSKKGWILISDAIALPDSIKNIEELNTALGEHCPWDVLGDQTQLFIMRDATQCIRAFEIRGGTKNFLLEYAILDFSTDDESRMPEGFSKLTQAKVAIVGVGSLGGKIAVSLARAGVKNFLLIDEDVLNPGNLVRNELDWRSVGFNKVDAVARSIKLVAPEAKVSCEIMNIGAQDNPQSSSRLSESLAACTLVIDATASSNAFVRIAAICKRSRIAMIWGELFGGGFGALMARSRPNFDADALTLRTHIYGVLESFAPIPEKEMQKAIRYGHITESKVLVGSDADVMMLAGAMTQFAIDAICADEQSEYPHAAYLMGYRKFWEFAEPFDTRPIACPAASTQVELDSELSEEDQQHLSELISALE